MTDESALRERLAELAGDLPMTPVDPAGLWSSGVRRQRRRRAAYAGGGLAAAVALVAGVALGGQVVGESAEPAPLRGVEESGLMLPDNFYAPSPWLGGSDEDGEIGPLAAVIAAERGRILGSGEPGFVGVSGATGEYRFLDLEHSIASGTQPALSADGRYLAYWFVGEPTVDLPAADAYVEGWSVYDTVSGKESVHAFEAGRGASTSLLAFAGENLWVQYTVWEESGGDGVAGHLAAPVLWSPGGSADDGAVLPKNLPEDLVIGADPSADGNTLIWAEGDSVQRLAPDGLRAYAGSWDTRTNEPLGGLIVRGDQEATLMDDGSAERCCLDSYPVLVQLGRRDAEVMHTVPGAVEASEVIAWRNRDELVVRQGGTLDRQRYAALNVQTGEQRLLTAIDGMGTLPIVAGDAWQAPTYHANEPDWPMNPRWIVVGGFVGGAAALVLLTLVWRRRAR